MGVMILAAGKASRMGQPKALLPYKNHTFLLNAFQLAQSIHPDGILCVLGHYYKQMSAYCAQHQIPCVFHPEYEQGMGSSISCGLQWLLSQYPSMNAVVILLADQPRIDGLHLSRMLHKLQQEQVQMVCTAYQGTRGAPAMFKKAFFSDLAGLKGEKGAKELIEMQELCEQNTVICESGYLDIDTPEDYDALLAAEKFRQ
jgi:molybdenum cofactor cytidylyltransferase